MARSLDRAKFDLMIFADVPRLLEDGNGGFEGLSKIARISLDPMAIAPVLAHETKGIGIIPTMSVSDWNPFMLSRLLASIDHVTNGRVGWNIVTGGSTQTAANVGYEPIGHDDRYVLAHEFLDVATQLWNSWEEDAVVLNEATGAYLDGSKIHHINFEGKFFRSRGPLTCPRTPQGRPVLAQAGSSPAGRDFAARFADLIVGSASSVPAMKEYRTDLHRRMRGYGRDPSEARILFLLTPHLATTQAEAEERFRLSKLGPESDMGIILNLLHRAAHWNIDLSKFDLDEPIPAHLTTQGHQDELARLIASGKTLREMASGGGDDHLVQIVGTPDSVAGQMEDIMQEVGGDGFLLFYEWPDRRVIAEVADGLVPVLQRRGLMRREYDSPYFRENLLAF
jgi:FMN-dependent oxidoreductase (nitrilotriacetate monooxygenase family)